MNPKEPDRRRFSKGSIRFLSQYFLPESGATSELLSGLAVELARGPLGQRSARTGLHNRLRNATAEL